MKTKKEYQKDIITFTIHLLGITFIVFGAYSLWFTNIYHYGWTALGYVVITSIFFEYIHQRYSYYNNEGTGFFLSGIIFFAIFLVITPVIKLETVYPTETLSTITYTKDDLVVDNLTKTITIKETGKSKTLDSDSFTFIKYYLLTQNKCTIIEQRTKKWTDSYEYNSIYCKKEQEIERKESLK